MSSAYSRLGETIRVSPSLEMGGGGGGSRVEELLADLATDGLAEELDRELGMLLREQGFDAEAERADVEAAAAAVGVAVVRHERREDASGSIAASDAVPPGVLASLHDLADRFSRSELDQGRGSWAGSAENVAAGAGVAPLKAADAESGGGPFRFAGRDDDSAAAPGGVSALAWSGWLAAAASLLVAVVLVNPADRAAGPAATADLAAVRGAADYERADWLGLDDTPFSPTAHPLDTGIVGQVEWSDSLDAGYMTISGLAQNDPDEFQYQLWIFDAERPLGQLPQYENELFPVLSQRPVDGGVFDFAPGPDGAATVAVDPKLPIGKAVIFAVTKEPPGGVVVSDRDIVFLAVASTPPAAG